MWWKKNKWKVIIPVLLAAVLVFAFWYGADAPGAHGWSAKGPESPPSVTATAQPSPSLTPTPVASPSSNTAVTPTASPTPAQTQTPAPTPVVSPDPSPTAEATPSPVPAPSPTPQTDIPEGYELVGGMLINQETGKDRYLTDPVPDGKPLPVEPEEVTIGTTAYTCTLSVSCATILDNMAYLDPEKVELIPEDGVILPPTEVTFYEGESVFNVLQRTLKQNRIHMEFKNTPIYNSAYIEGIHNLYEFDCGELSGWMYKVNGWFPNYGCSRYSLQDGDVIEWVYTCDLGDDVGGGYATGG